MVLKVHIGGEGVDSALIKDEALLVSVLPYPPAGVAGKTLPFTGALTVNGDGITIDLNVDGSTIPIDAFIGPPVTGDLYLTTANVLIADNGAVALNKFGSQSSLTNGISFFIETENKRTSIGLSLKSNFDFIRVGTLTQGTGGKTDAYQLANTDSANNDGYNPVLDFRSVSPTGIRLRKDTLDKIGIEISDDLTGVATFNVLINGYIRI